MREFFDISFFYTSVEDIPDKEELKKLRKEILLQFQFSDKNFISIDDIEFSKQKIVDLFEDFIANYDFYIKLRTLPDIFLLLNNKDNKPFYCILSFEHNSDFGVWLKPFVNDELYKRYVSYFNGEMDAKAVNNLIVINNYFKKDYLAEANEKIEENLLNYVNDLSKKYLHKDLLTYNRNSYFILNDWSINKHNLIAHIINKPLLAMTYAQFLNSLIIEIVNNSQRKFARMPDSYYTLLRLTARFVDNTLHTCKQLADQIDDINFGIYDTNNEEVFSGFKIMMGILYLLGVLLILARLL